MKIHLFRKCIILFKTNIFLNFILYKIFFNNKKNQKKHQKKTHVPKQSEEKIVEEEAIQQEDTEEEKSVHEETVVVKEETTDVEKEVTEETDEVKEVTEDMDEVKEEVTEEVKEEVTEEVKEEVTEEAKEETEETTDVEKEIKEVPEETDEVKEEVTEEDKKESEENQDDDGYEIEEIVSEVKNNIHYHTHTHTHTHVHTHNYNAKSKNISKEVTEDIIDFMIASNETNAFISITSDKQDDKCILITISEESLRDGFNIYKNSIVKEVYIGPIDKSCSLVLTVTNQATRKLNESRMACDKLYDVYKIKCDVAEFDEILGLFRKQKYAVLKLGHLSLDYEKN